MRILPGYGFTPFDINDRGQIVGSSVASTTLHAALWENGVLTDLDPLGLESYALAVNEQGDVVGIYDNGPVKSARSFGRRA